MNDDDDRVGMYSRFELLPGVNPQDLDIHREQQPRAARREKEGARKEQRPRAIDGAGLRPKVERHLDKSKALNAVAVQKKYYRHTTAVCLAISLVAAWRNQA